MVQGKLLTHRPGGVHGGGEGPGGDPPLRQGAGKSSPGAPDLGSAAAEKQRCDRGKRALVLRVSRRALNIRQRVASEGTRGAQAAPRRGLGGGRATRAPRPLVAPLRLSFGVPEGSETLIFYIFFPDFF